MRSSSTLGEVVLLSIMIVIFPDFNCLQLLFRDAVSVGVKIKSKMNSKDSNKYKHDKSKKINDSKYINIVAKVIVE